MAVLLGGGGVELFSIAEWEVSITQLKESFSTAVGNDHTHFAIVQALEEEAMDRCGECDISTEGIM